MCMIACEDCHADVDPSEDNACFVEIGNMRRMHREIVLCETCRWLRADQQELADHYAAQAEADAEAIETATLAYGVW